MRFTIAREKLQEALTNVAPAVPAKTTLPVLANILVEASERGVRFSGTDLDVGRMFPAFPKQRRNARGGGLPVPVDTEV